jgi:hypothetical protein
VSGAFEAQVARLKQYMDENPGRRAYFLYDENTPDAVLDYAREQLGAENVLPLPPAQE